METKEKSPKTKRKVQKWAGRPTDKVIDERVIEALQIIANKPDVHKCQLHKIFVTRWNCHWRTVDRIVARARESLIERLGRTREQFRSEALAFYEARMNDPNATFDNKMRARERIDELLGLDAPKQHEVSGRDGNAIELEHSRKEPIDAEGLGKLARRLYGIPEADGDGQSVHSAHADAEASILPGDT